MDFVEESRDIQLARGLVLGLPGFDPRFAEPTLLAFVGDDAIEISLGPELWIIRADGHEEIDVGEVVFGFSGHGRGPIQITLSTLNQ